MLVIVVEFGFALWALIVLLWAILCIVVIYYGYCVCCFDCDCLWLLPTGWFALVRFSCMLVWVLAACLIVLLILILFRLNVADLC